MRPTVEQLQDFFALIRLGRVTKENFQGYLDVVRKLTPEDLFTKLTKKARKLASEALGHKKFDLYLSLASVSGYWEDFRTAMNHAPTPFETCKAYLAYAESEALPKVVMATAIEEARVAAQEIVDNYQQAVAFASIAAISDRDDDYSIALSKAFKEQVHRTEYALIEVVKAYCVNGRLDEARGIISSIKDSMRRVEALVHLAKLSQDQKDREGILFDADKVTSSRYNMRTRAEAFALLSQVFPAQGNFDEAERCAMSCVSAFDGNITEGDRDLVIIKIIKAHLVWNNYYDARRLADEVKTSSFRPEAFSLIAEATGDDSDFSRARGALKHAESVSALVAFARAVKAHKKSS